MIPLRTDSPLRNTPYMNWVLIAANVVMFLFQQAGHHDGRPWYNAYELSPRDPRLYTYFTYAFLHGNIMHIVFNMLFLYVFGNNVNDKMGNLGYLAFYLAGGVFAGIAYVLWQPANIPVLGASGAIAAVTGAYLILFPRSNVTVLNLFLFIGSFEIACFWFVGFFFFQDVFLNFSRQDDTVAHMAHIGGTLFGSMICIALLSVHLLPRDQFDVVALIKQWNRRRQYRDAVSTGWNPYLSPAPPSASSPFAGAGPFAPPRETIRASRPADARTGRVLELRGMISDAVTNHDLPRAAELYLELKSLDPEQVLARQAQLDVANQLAGQQLYPAAAEAYELFLRHYPKFEQIEQVELMLGIIYARYLSQYERAREYLVKAVARLHGDRELAMARSELARIEPLIAAQRPAG